MAHPFRIALRREGKWWVAYLANPNTMEVELPPSILVGPKERV